MGVADAQVTANLPSRALNPRLQVAHNGVQYNQGATARNVAAKDRTAVRMAVAVLLMVARDAQEQANDVMTVAQTAAVPQTVVSVASDEASCPFDPCLDQRHTRVEKNIDEAESKAIYDLKYDTSIVVKPADKGGATVILNRESYTKIALEQLKDTAFYCTLRKDPVGPVFLSVTTSMGGEIQI
ncbi:hypothetical protein HOLleu_28969 [Holothuria leucospilota]|uniref:Uncharacterized protein n=1 Tax=Holothuria leucospilota TaxID=206669 RepID=A0A9Q1BMV5_HOLLE|nr:hypothetical protein HOLleu_28969 [Holothuria leucospilota]